MNIVFLDMDGVLVHHRCPHDGGTFITNGDPVCVERLARILRGANARIVLHSTWAYVDSREYLINWFRGFGIDKFLHPDFICMSTDPGKRDKAEAIDTWLSEHPDVDRYIILEDEQLYGITDARRGKLIHILAGWEKGGLQDKHVETAIKCLTYRF